MWHLDNYKMPCYRRSTRWDLGFTHINMEVWSCGLQNDCCENLSVNTEYHCKARLIKVDEEEGQAAGWTDQINVTTQEPELLLMQIIVEDEETRNLSKVASVTAKEIKSEESTTSLIVFLAIYSIVVALVIVIAYNCRGSRNPKYPYPIVSFLFSNTLQRRADHAISYDVKQNQFLLCMCTIWRNG